MYPFFHWRESEDASIVPDPELSSVVAALPVIDSSLMELAEVREYIDARVHDLARSHLSTDEDLARGDARWLRAKLRSLEQVLPPGDLRTRKAAEIIAKHVDDDGANGIDAAISSWRQQPLPADELRKIEQAMAADRAHASGVRSVIYREVGGVPLHLYVLEPTKPRSEPVPTMLWLHGGSAMEGTWWHSPVTTAALLEAGVIVIAVELTTGNRFDRDSDQITDASAAFDYVVSHARELGVDERRIGAAGFSSGASLALLLATRGVAPARVDTESSRRFRRPSAVIVSGACADPLSQHEDGYFRKTMSRIGNPADFSPYAQIGAGQPPVLSVHATADEYCAFSDMSRFAERYRALGNEITLVSVEGASHFFGFYHEQGQRLQRDAIVDALRRWRW
jgi:acetyl esterase/lipase